MIYILIGLVLAAIAVAVFAELFPFYDEYVHWEEAEGSMQTKMIAIRYTEILYLHKYKSKDDTYTYTWCDNKCFTVFGPYTELSAAMKAVTDDGYTLDKEGAKK